MVPGAVAKRPALQLEHDDWPASAYRAGGHCDTHGTTRPALALNVPGSQALHVPLSLKRPAGQPPDTSGMQRPVDGSHTVYDDGQSAAATGQRTAAASTAATQQQRRV